MQITRAQKQQSHHAASLKKMAGLGLLEVMLFLFVIGTILVVGYTWLAAKKQSERAEAQTAQLQYVNRYIESFAAVNFRLPCPATTRGGVEDCGVATNVKGYLPLASIGLDATDPKVGGGELLYMLSRSALADLGKASNSFEPKNLKHTAAVPDTFAFDQVTTGDYCLNLAVAATETAGVRVFNGSTGRRVAYAIAHPGVANADATGSTFDGRNADLTNLSMEAPETAQSATVYDDRVLARTPNELLLTGDCAGHIASLDLMGLGVNVIAEVQAQFADAKEAAELEIRISIFKTVMAAYDVGLAALGLATGIAELAAYTSALAAAVILCIIVIGCPLAVALGVAVTTQGLAIAANGIAVGLAATAVGINILYIVLVAEVAALAGSAAGAANPNLTALIASALTDRNNKIVEKNNAAAALVVAQSNLAVADPPRIAAESNLYTTTRNTIVLANAAGVPPTSSPNTENDIYVVDAVVKFTALTQATENKVAAAQALAIAVAAAAIPPTVDEAAGIAGKQQRLSDAIAGQAAAQTAYDASRATLIATNNRAYLVTSPGSPPTTVTQFINNQAAVTAQLVAYEGAYTTYSARLAAVVSAQSRFDAAAAAEATAIDYYNQLISVSPPSGTAPANWLGAEAILKAADAKGGAQ